MNHNYSNALFIAYLEICTDRKAFPVGKSFVSVC
jgi:hypothetical protein